MRSRGPPSYGDVNGSGAGAAGAAGAAVAAVAAGGGIAAGAVVSAWMAAANC